MYAVDEAGVCYSIAAASGEERWRRAIETDYVNGVPTVADGTVYLAIEDGTVVALDTADGRERWRRETASPSSCIAVADDTVFVVGSEGCLALATDDGAKRWEIESATGTVCSVGANALVVGGSETLHALSRADGTTLWSFETRSVLFSDYTASGIPFAPALVDDVVVVATQASDIYALGAAATATGSSTP